MSASTSTTRSATWAAVLVAAFMIAQQLAGKALRDAFFLSHFGASALPAVMSAAALLSVAAVFGSARLFKRIAPSRVLPIFFGGSAALFVGEWALSLFMPKVAAVSVYLHTSFGAVVVSGFWLVVNERFDPHTAKRVIGRIAGGATLGGVAGGLAAWSGATLLSIPTMILILGVVNAICALTVPAISSVGSARREEAPPENSTLTIFEETPYLRHLALLVGFGGFTGAISDYVLKSRAALHFDSEPELVSFFALLYLGIALATFALQSLLAQRVVRFLGLAFTVATLPGAGVGLGLLAFLFPGLFTFVAFRGGTAVVESSLYRSGYELLYTPLPPEKKRPTKALIDVGADKLGATAGAGFAFFIVGIFPLAASVFLVGIAVVVSAAALLVTRSLHRGYMASLADSLRTGAIDPADVEAIDAATLQTIVAIDRAKVLEGLEVSARPAVRVGPERKEVLSQLRGGASVGDARRRASPDRVHPPLRHSSVRGVGDVDAIGTAILGLRSEDQGRIAAALRVHNPLPDALVSHVIPLLSDDAAAVHAVPALQRVAPTHVGQLLDALLRPRTPLAVRRRLCDVLGAVATERSAGGLAQVLQDEAFELRFRAASGLLRILQRNDSIRLPRESVLQAVRVEASSCARRWKYQTTVDGTLTQTPPVESVEGKRVLQGLAYIFTLLLAVFDREPLRLAIRALAHDDRTQRGTGLEFLEQMLPGDLREILWPLLTDRRLALGSLWSEADILADLVQDASQEPDLSAVRRWVQERRSGP